MKKEIRIYFDETCDPFFEFFGTLPVLNDIYDKYVTAKGCLNRDLSDSNVHIKNPIHIIDFILKNLKA